MLLALAMQHGGRLATLNVPVASPALRLMTGRAP